MKPGQLVAVVAGIWLMAAPAVLGYSGTGADDVHRTVGPVVATMGTIALWAAVRDVRWVNLAGSLALLLAPAFATHPPEAMLAGVATAIVVVVATPFGGPSPGRRGRGWRGAMG